MKENKEIFLTDAADEILEKSIDSYRQEILNVLEREKFIPGEKFIEGTAADIDNIVRRIKIVKTNRLKFRRLYLQIFLLLGLLSLFAGLIYPQLRGMFSNPIQMALIIVGITLTGVSLFTYRLLIIRHSSEPSDYENLRVKVANLERLQREKTRFERQVFEYFPHEIDWKIMFPNHGSGIDSEGFWYHVMVEEWDGKENNHLYGPYKKLSKPGKYFANYEIKASIPPDTNPDVIVCQLVVDTDGSSKPLSVKRSVKYSELSFKGFTNIPVVFDYTDEILEFRINHCFEGTLWCGSIVIFELEDEVATIGNVILKWEKSNSEGKRKLRRVEFDLQ